MYTQFIHKCIYNLNVFNSKGEQNEIFTIRSLLEKPSPSTDANTNPA